MNQEKLCIDPSLNLTEEQARELTQTAIERFRLEFEENPLSTALAYLTDHSKTLKDLFDLITVPFPEELNNFEIYNYPQDALIDRPYSYRITCVSGYLMLYLIPLNKNISVKDQCFMYVLTSDDKKDSKIINFKLYSSLKELHSIIFHAFVSLYNHEVLNSNSEKKFIFVEPEKIVCDSYSRAKFTLIKYNDRNANVNSNA